MTTVFYIHQKIPGGYRAIFRTTDEREVREILTLADQIKLTRACVTNHNLGEPDDHSRRYDGELKQFVADLLTASPALAGME